MKTRTSEFHNLIRLAAIGAALALTVGCVKGGNVTSSGSEQSSGAITISLVYPTSQGSTWTPITSGSRYFIKGLDLTITGVCTRGVDKVKVDEGGGPYTETASCSGEGSFTFNKTYTSGQQGDKTLTLTAYDISDTAITGATATTTVRIDDTAPSAPVVTTPATSPYTEPGSSSTTTISGTCSADTVKLTGPGGSTITPSGTNWSYDATLVEGADTDYTFYAFDLAGNQSGGTTQTITWAPVVTVHAKGGIPGGQVTDGASSFKLEAAVFVHSSISTDTNGSGKTLETGFNFITNTVRAN